MHNHIIATACGQRSQQIVIVSVDQCDFATAGLDLGETPCYLMPCLREHLTQLYSLGVVVAEDPNHPNLERGVVFGDERGRVVAGVKHKLNGFHVQPIDDISDSRQAVV
jgi:hypothetical protein